MCTKSDVSNIDFVIVLDSFNNNDLDIGWLFLNFAKKKDLDDFGMSILEVEFSQWVITHYGPF
jgi:hypothetical protein